MLGEHKREVLGSLTCSWGPSCPCDMSGPFTLGKGPLCLTLFSPPGEEFYEASPYEPVTSRLSDIFRLASIFSGKWARAGASLGLLFSLVWQTEPWAWLRCPASPFMFLSSRSSSVSQET